MWGHKFPLCNIVEILCGDIKFPLYNIEEILCGDIKVPLRGNFVWGHKISPMLLRGNFVWGPHTTGKMGLPL